MSHGDDVEWLTYSQLAKARGISTASARRLAFRHKWRRQHGNDGTARVAVPMTETQPRGGDSHDDTTDASPDVTRIVSGFEAAIAVLREQLTAAELRAERAEQAVAGERSRADNLRDRLDAAVAAQREAVEAAEALRQGEVSRRAKGLLARLASAWRGD